ncbi:hypothetical protein [Demequina sp.]|uniref:hypothetical protein n=1 Tax=Demequina sp. TaxID=2050685 RepID=UPI003A890AA4
MASTLAPEFTVNPSALDTLEDGLAGVDLNDLLYSSEQAGSAASTKVYNADGSLLGVFEHSSTSEQCWAMAWGSYPEPGPNTSPSAAATA